MKRRLLPLLLAGVVSVGCLTDPFTGSTVVADFLSDLAPNVLVQLPDGSDSYYALWVNFGESGSLNVGRFWVTGDGHIQDYPDVETRIGSVTGADDGRRSGVRWVSQANLDRATSVFVTLEQAGATDVTPSPYVIMGTEGGTGAEPLTTTAPGELRGQMTGEYENELGQTLFPVARVTIIIAQDNATF